MNFKHFWVKTDFGQVANVNFVNEPVVLFLRLDEALNVDHLCEIPTSPTR
jgi:hypothetical protein